MYACVLLACAVVLTDAVTVRRHRSQPDTNHKEELPPLLISCGLNDIVTISAPVSPKMDALYYLNSPNGEVTELNITSPVKLQNYETKVIKDVKDNSITWSSGDYRVTITNVNSEQNASSKTNDVLVWKENDFVIGPLCEENHGNWVLSIFHKENGTWFETFQVITIEIIETVPVQPQLPELNQGDTLELSFAYPIKDLQSCQLTVPKSSFDRYYERRRGDACSFVVRNITENDAGTWGIIGVGRIVYMGNTTVKVKNKIT